MTLLNDPVSNQVYYLVKGSAMYSISHRVHDEVRQQIFEHIGENIYSQVWLNGHDQMHLIFRINQKYYEIS
jgi:hypothetical protein